MHAEHVPTPLAALNEPPPHSSHVLCPPDVWYVPGLHSVALVEPVEQNEPAGQSVHSAAEPKPVASLYVPSRHGSAAAAPWGQYEPSGHSEPTGDGFVEPMGQR